MGFYTKISSFQFQVGNIIIYMKMTSMVKMKGIARHRGHTLIKTHPTANVVNVAKYGGNL